MVAGLNISIEDDVDRDVYCTPLDWAMRLGRAYLDPCSNERSHILADRTFRLDRGQDGLKLARYVSRTPSGIVFINPPYSRGMVIQFVRAYKHTRFCFLVRYDTSTEWFAELYQAASLFLLPWERIDFEPPPGVETTGNVYPHAFIYRDAADATPAMRAACYCMRKD